MKSLQVLGNLLGVAFLMTQPVNAIVGGSDASANDAPFTVAIISSGWLGSSHICAGSLIGPKTVITTAQCVDGSSASSLKVRVGSLEHGTGGKLNQVTSVIKHPNYNTNTLDYDYGILWLTNAVTDIDPVKIATESPLTGTPVSLYGWGQTGKLLKENSRTLQRLDTTYISSSDCRSAWSDINPVTGRMNCDAAPEKQQGSCAHDQGGPVVSEAGELVGIMGHYDYCDPSSNGRPDVNNDPVVVTSWINTLRAD
ncbi:trypsin-like cysteine/serine peptidase domain-containing protein [Aspergillus bertholletiae]|uniref:Trypsin-like cysteine/serine peptidase domain-containing protein n=1 Tax=Aspergillus bertholletiae TaxID=1226010 RepID=A0A5N7ANG1_9EURO|nr:trypsin-like cysteine/serine peptidase domain-containing protein [Aspergillus bertholletiae]